MPVVVNEFEVVPGTPATPPQNAPAGTPTEPPPDPAKAEAELERALRHLHIRTARLHAT
jgi:hypothetical protein